MNWFWRVYYFEAGAEQPYRSRRFFTRSHLECALTRFSRMGGADVRRGTGLRGLADQASPSPLDAITFLAPPNLFC